MQYQELLRRAEFELMKLEALLPVARATDSMEAWCRLYAEGYILKLRAMR